MSLSPLTAARPAKRASLSLMTLACLDLRRLTRCGFLGPLEILSSGTSSTISSCSVSVMIISSSTTSIGISSMIGSDSGITSTISSGVNVSGVFASKYSANRSNSSSVGGAISGWSSRASGSLFQAEITAVSKYGAALINCAESDLFHADLSHEINRQSSSKRILSPSSLTISITDFVPQILAKYSRPSRSKTALRLPSRNP